MRYVVILFAFIVVLLNSSCSGAGDVRPEITAGGTWSMGIGGRLGKF